MVALLAGGLFFLFGRDNSPAPVSVTLEPVVDVVVHTVIGRSVEGRAIDAYTYGTGKDRFLFVGGIHGGYEWNSVLLAYTFMDYLEANPDVIPSTASVTVVPSANPDGV
jgi:murein tripeptide amidase MpaA